MERTYQEVFAHVPPPLISIVNVRFPQSEARLLYFADDGLSRRSKAE
jgi:hypothetical protein